MIAAALFAGSAAAHEWTPTYPKLKTSFMENILVTDMTLFNHRDDIEYYEIQAFDDEWKPVSFASTSKLIEAKHLEKKKVQIYFRTNTNVVYICTVSKALKGSVESSGIKSRICSKIER